MDDEAESLPSYSLHGVARATSKGIGLGRSSAVQCVHTVKVLGSTSRLPPTYHYTSKKNTEENSSPRLFTCFPAPGLARYSFPTSPGACF